LPDDPDNRLARLAIKEGEPCVGCGVGAGESDVPLGSFVSCSAFEGDGDAWAAEARRENKPRRGLGWSFDVEVDGVGDDTVLDITGEESGVSVFGEIGFVDDLARPFAFCREPRDCFSCIE